MTTASRSIQGSIPALITPMLADGQVDYPTLRKLIDWHVAEGTDALVIVGFVLAVVCLVGFVLFERRQEHPMLDMQFFSNPRFGMGALGITITFFAMFAMFATSRRREQPVWLLAKSQSNQGGGWLKALIARDVILPPPPITRGGVSGH